MRPSSYADKRRENHVRDIGVIMIDYGTIFSAVLPVFLLIGIGWFMRARGWFSAQAEKDVMRLFVCVLYPCLILRFVLGNEVLRDGGLVTEALGTGYLSVVAGVLVAASLAPCFGIRNARERGSFAVAVAVYNYGNIAIPVAALFFPDSTVGVMLVVNVGIDLAIWTLGLAVMAGRFSRRNSRYALSPPALAVFVGLLLNDVGGQAFIPSPVLGVVEMLAACAIPISIFVIGSAFCELARESGIRLRLNIALGAIFMRHLLLPVLMLGTACLIPFSPAIRCVILVHAAMPCGIFPVVLAKHYGGSGKLVFQAVMTSGGLSMLTIPLWIQIGFRVLGVPVR